MIKGADEEIETLRREVAELRAENTAIAFCLKLVWARGTNNDPLAMNIGLPPELEARLRGAWDSADKERLPRQPG